MRLLDFFFLFFFFSFFFFFFSFKRQKGILVSRTFPFFSTDYNIFFPKAKWFQNSRRTSDGTSARRMSPFKPASPSSEASGRPPTGPSSLFYLTRASPRT